MQRNDGGPKDARTILTQIEQDIMIVMTEVQYIVRREMIASRQVVESH
jgi:hypothetical protein